MSSQRLKLLIVDDDEVDRMALRRALQAGGVHADIDDDTSAAGVVERLRTSRYDCVIVDFGLPGEDGLSLVRRIRASHDRTPILAVTGHEEEVGAQLVAAGASDYLSKGDISPARLASRLRFAIRIGQAEEQARAALDDLGRERRLLEATLRQMPSAAIIAEPTEERILLANEQLDVLLGQPVSRRDTIAQLRRYAAFRPDGTPLGADDWPLVRAMRQGVSIPEEELIIDRPDGRRAVVRARAEPIVSTPGNPPSAAVMTLEDLTAERAARAELERALRARDEILAIVSHDLRNPLNAVSVAVDELADAQLDDSSRQQYVGAIRRSVSRADRLIRDLLDVSRIEAGKLSVEPHQVDTRALLDLAQRDHDVLLREAGVAVSVDILAGAERIAADRDRMLQALGNLIGNALRYARVGRILDLSAVPEENHITLRVGDRGPGIPPDALPHIFDRFWQAHRQRRAGAGLGLAIAKGIVEAHGGRIRAENREGGGACFCVSLPTASA
jgi:signal transduction histidine kinase